MANQTWTGPEPPITHPDGTVEYVRPYDHAVRRELYGNRRSRRLRNRSPPITPPPPSLTLTRHIQTPANIFDTDEEADNEVMTHIAQELAPDTPEVTLQAAIDAIPTSLAEQLGLLDIAPERIELAIQLMNVPEEHQWPLTVIMLMRGDPNPEPAGATAAQSMPAPPELACHPRGRRNHTFAFPLALQV
ncbi:uncharacterized protein PGTG_22709 [Puccinia graminis f. sp. tritici CRL 75-36-700-3]|uniref:Uncharacterized protein n=1 Tax=Puccinia graminis f. sp. tritici (strain CRL 75-36-700-3 / race SCCL) TaxID=418459 RepID=H6QVD3_PUCGT|nr:uncharacterized protein PGTG_22709 [Puccinia graminis f. sp. tritici CRL 75-36-700-3]EHS62862.1 hypothetical protein PGTG_22709 [Puccinia graminis f. sp. tritici CRL 75-36-700-3]